MSQHIDPTGEQPSLTDDQRERIVKIWRSCCGALQTVVTDLEITQDELKLAGRFFNRLGESGMFPSLLAVGLAMTSMRVTEGIEGTPPNLEGPYYMPNAPIRENGVLWEKPLGPNARRLELSGMVRDSKSGKPVS